MLEVKRLPRVGTNPPSPRIEAAQSFGMDTLLSMCCVHDSDSLRRPALMATSLCGVCRSLGFRGKGLDQMVD
jgi:hypothetical protein